MRVMSDTNEAPLCALFDISFSRQRTLSTVPLGKSRGTGRHCRRNQHRKFALPTTKTCESCQSQSRSRPGDVSFHVHTWTQRTTKQCFQQPIFSISNCSDWDIAKNNLTTVKASQCRAISGNVCGPINQELACLGSFVPEGAADTTTNFVFTNFFLF